MSSNAFWKDAACRIRVTPASPCPICQHDSFCIRSADGTKALCMRVESSRPIHLGVGTGYLHNLSEPLPSIEVRVSRKGPPQDWGRRAEQMASHRLADEARHELSDSLGVSVESLVALGVGVGWDHRGMMFMSFPCQNAGGTVVGVVRRYPNGRKLTIKGGSNSGVFTWQNWWETKGPVYVPEGPTDTAALFDLGRAALGRPSNSGGFKVLAELLWRHAHQRRVIVLGERDSKPEKRGQMPGCTLNCAGCAHCWPGKYGAKRLAKQLSKALKTSVSMKFPNGKDIREDLLNGAMT